MFKASFACALVIVANSLTAAAPTEDADGDEKIAIEAKANTSLPCLHDGNTTNVTKVMEEDVLNTTLSKISYYKSLTSGLEVGQEDVEVINVIESCRSGKEENQDQDMTFAECVLKGLNVTCADLMPDENVTATQTEITTMT